MISVIIFLYLLLTIYRPTNCSIISILLISNYTFHIYFYHSAPVFVEQSAANVTSSPTLYSTCLLSCNLPFSQKVKIPSISSLFLLSLFSPLRTDISGVDQASLCHLGTFHDHSPSFHSFRCLFYLTCKCL